MEEEIRLNKEEVFIINTLRNFLGVLNGRVMAEREILRNLHPVQEDEEEIQPLSPLQFETLSLWVSIVESFDAKSLFLSPADFTFLSYTLDYLKNIRSYIFRDVPSKGAKGFLVRRKENWAVACKPGDIRNFDKMVDAVFGKED